MNTQKLFSIAVEVGSITLSIYGFANALYWYWIFLNSVPAQTISSNTLVLQGVPLSHIIESLLTIALGGFIHTMNRLWPEILDLFEHVEQKVEANVNDMKTIEELRTRVQKLEERLKEKEKQR